MCRFCKAQYLYATHPYVIFITADPTWLNYLQICVSSPFFLVTMWAGNCNKHLQKTFQPALCAISRLCSYLMQRCSQWKLLYESGKNAWHRETDRRSHILLQGHDGDVTSQMRLARAVVRFDENPMIILRFLHTKNTYFFVLSNQPECLMFTVSLHLNLLPCVTLICMQFRLVIISLLFSLELPNLRLISSAVKRNQLQRMASCFIYTNRRASQKNFHNIQNGK